MTAIGGELGQLESLRSTLDREAHQVQQMMTTIRTQLESTFWTGPASNRFRDQWQNDFEPSLRKLHEALSQSAAEVNRRREALLQAGS